MAISSLPSVLAVLGAKASCESDAELLARYVSDRNEAAFTALVHRYARLVWRVARTRCRTDATAEDVLQATFVVLANKAAAIRTGGALPGWLHRTAHRLAVKAARRDRPTTPLPSDIPMSADPLDALSARELLAAVDAEMANLSDAERSVLVLCGTGDHSLDEAAKRLGWSVGSVKGRLERARAKLRTRLDARGLILPAVVMALLGGPPAGTVQAAMALHGGTIPPAIEQLVSEGARMTRRFITMGLVAVLVAGGVGAGLGVIPHDGPPAAVAAPVPKQRGPVVWSAPLDLKETVTLRSTCGVWLPDGSGVLVPAPVKGKDGKRTPGGVEVRDAKTGEVVSRHAADVPEGGTFQAVAVGVSPDGSQVFAGGTVFTGKTPAHRLFTWKADTEKPELANDFGFPISAISGPPDGKTVSVVEAANAVVQLQLPSGAAFSAWSLNKKIYQAGVHHPSGKYILVVTESGTVAAAETKFGKMIGLMSYDAAFHAVAVSPDGSRIAAGGAPGKAKQSLVVIDEASDKTIGNNFRTFADAVPEKEAIHGLAFSRDGKHLAAACSDGLIRVFDTETGKLVTTSPREHDGPVYSLAYSPDGKKLLTLGKDAIRVWDVERLMNAK